MQQELRDDGVRDEARAAIRGGTGGGERRGLLLEHRPELLRNVVEVGHRVRLRVRLHVGERVLVGLVEVEAKLVELVEGEIT